MSEQQQTFECGIENIHYKHLYGASYLDGIREAQIKHGQKLFDANHVFAVKERREPGGVGGSEITGYCDRETNINEGAYRCYIKIDKDRKVIPGGFECNCKAGGGGHFTKLKITIILQLCMFFL